MGFRLGTPETLLENNFHHNLARPWMGERTLSLNSSSLMKLYPEVLPWCFCGDCKIRRFLVLVVRWLIGDLCQNCLLFLGIVISQTQELGVPWRISISKRLTILRNLNSVATCTKHGLCDPLHNDLQTVPVPHNYSLNFINFATKNQPTYLVIWHSHSHQSPSFHFVDNISQ